MAYVQLTFMLHHRIHGFLLTELTVWKAFQRRSEGVFMFFMIIEGAAMKTQYLANIWKAALAPFAQERGSDSPLHSDSKKVKIF